MTDSDSCNTKVTTKALPFYSCVYYYSMSITSPVIIGSCNQWFLILYSSRMNAEKGKLDGKSCCKQHKGDHSRFLSSRPDFSSAADSFLVALGFSHLASPSGGFCYFVTGFTSGENLTG